MTNIRCLWIRVCACYESNATAARRAALNSALSAARGQWLMELDADDWLAPDCASAIAARARDDDRAGAIYADCVEWRELSGKRLVYAGTRSIAEPLDAWRLLEQPFPLAPRAFRIALLRRLGGWLVTDPFDGRLYEDLQMLARVVQERPLLRIPRALYHRRIRLTSITQRSKASYPAWKAWMRETLLRERPDR
nr:glycosyltransferase [Cohnella massiliensis]